MTRGGRQARRYNPDDPVALLPCADYSLNKVRAIIEEGLKHLGGLKDFIKPGERVLLKPNFLRPARPETAVTTHPAIVEAVAGLVRKAGAFPMVGDSPGYTSCRQVAKTAGIAEVCNRLDIPLLPFKEKALLPVHGEGRFRRLEVAQEVMEADKIINLPKAKTHQQMTLTLGVKNIFGCVVGLDKSKWHLMAGTDARHFGRMIAELAVAIGADLTILDAVLGMDGDGPGGGRPRPFGFVALGPNPFAIDIVVSELFGIAPKRVPALKAGIDLGVAPTRAKDCEILGDEAWKKLIVSDFLPPSAASISFRIPGPIFRLLKRFLTPTPKIDRQRCVLCNACVEVCPANCMSNSNGKIIISKKDCISCYCCAEVCPHKAVKIQ